MRGFFAIGAEGISKPMNLGNLIRSAHAFGASFVFLARTEYGVRSAASDTSRAQEQLPVYDFPSVAELRLPLCPLSEPSRGALRSALAPFRSEAAAPARAKTSE